MPGMDGCAELTAQGAVRDGKSRQHSLMSYKQLRLKIEQCDVFLGDVAVALIR
jgi:hypothetical protein